METKIAECPLGAKCEEIKDNVKYLCPWYTQVRGTDPQTGDSVEDWKCAMAWLPIMLIENTMMGRQTGAAVESFRNEMVKGNDQFIGMLTAVKGSNKSIGN